MARKFEYPALLRHGGKVYIMESDDTTRVVNHSAPIPSNAIEFDNESAARAALNRMD